MLKWTLLSDTSDSVYIIAEAGVNHNGDIEIAKKLVNTAKEAGADAIKFQTFSADKIVTKAAMKAKYQEKNDDEVSQYEMLKKLQLSEEDHFELRDHCQRVGIEFLSTGFDFGSVDLLEKLDISLYKIGSGDLTNLPLLKYIAEKGRPIILSTGMATMGEIEDAVECIYSTGNRQLSLLHCTSNYPPKIEDTNLRAMLTVGTVFDVPFGYSDHTPGIEVPMAAVAMGAKIIEKHITLDKNMKGPDHEASLDPEELKSMVRGIRKVEKALGSSRKKPVPAEMEIRMVARKSIVAARNLKAGSVITEEDLAFKRPGTGLSPATYQELLGKKVREGIDQDEQITWISVK